MTKVRIKTDMVKREFTISSDDGHNDVWTLSSSGYLSQRYEAATLGEAVDKGLILVMTMKRDPACVAARKPRESYFGRPVNGTQIQAPQPIQTPVVPMPQPQQPEPDTNHAQARKGKPVEKPAPAA